MKIALTADPELPVPPLQYGGIERIVDMLAKELTGRGHDVTLFAHADSQSAGRLVSWPGKSSHSKSDLLSNTLTLTREITRGDFDLVHSFSRLAYLLPILPLPLPKLMTYQREINRRSVVVANRLSRNTLQFSAISKAMMIGVADVGSWHLVYNGVPLDTFAFVDEVDANAPFVFLGRIEEIKGPHIAIDAARRAGRRLIVAGNVPAAHRAWFDQNISPLIDGTQISYIGAVDDEQKSALLGGAKALLMPILWEEPFGIVMAEAMACGTPVIGFRKGAVPEIITDGVTGYVVDTVDELAAAMEHLGRISRRKTREAVERRFSQGTIADAYLSIYARMVSARKRGSGV